MLIGLAAVVLAIIATVRVARLERELGLLRRRLEAAERRLSGPVAVAPAAEPSPESLPRPAPHAAPHSAPHGAPHGIPAPPPSITPPPRLAAGTRSHVPAGRPSAPSAPPSGAVTGVGAPSRPVAGGRGRSEGSLERRIGERLLLYAGMLLVLFAAGFFLRYAFEHDWVPPALRVSLGAVAGLALVIGGHRLVRAGYEQYGLFLAGGGFAVLFLAVYAAFAIYALIGQLPAFILLVATAAGAAALADRHVSLPLALMAVCGGFLAPFLVSTGSDAQITLFTYDAVLVGATMYLAHRRGWPALNLASFLFTVATVGAWMIDRYTPGRYLSTELFLTLFCALFVGILRENMRSTRPNAPAVTALLMLAPVLYHLTSIGILFEHGVAFLIYVTLASVALVIASFEARTPAIRFIGWLGVALPLAVWVAAHQSEGWTAASIVVAVTVWLVAVSTGARSAWRGEEVDAWDLRLIHSAGLAAFGIVYVALTDVIEPASLATVATAFSLANIGVWAAVRARSEAAVHWLGVGAALAAVAVAIGFDGYWSVVMWSAEAAALMIVGIRTGRFWFRVGGLVLFAIATGVWLQSIPPEREGPFMLLLNARALAGLSVIGLLYLVGSAQKAAAGEEGNAPYERAVVLVGAHALTVVWLSLEITSFWEARGATTIGADFGREVTLSSIWAIYAAALIAVGMRRHYAPIRYFAMALFGLTLLKVVFVDSQALDGIHRVLAYLVVGALMLGVSFLYWRMKDALEPGDSTAEP